MTRAIKGVTGCAAGLMFLAACTPSPKEEAKPTPPPAPVKPPDAYKVEFETSKGNFTVEVQREWSPRGADHFHELVMSRFYDGARFHRVAVFLPVVLSTIIVAYLFKLFLHPLFGVVNITLRTIGLPMLAQPWLGQDSTALWALIFAGLYALYSGLVFLAAAAVALAPVFHRMLHSFHLAHESSDDRSG